MIASCGMRVFWCVFVNAKIAAPRSVKPSEKTYAPFECISKPARYPTVPPSAAIWASERSTKMTPRSTTWTPR